MAIQTIEAIRNYTPREYVLITAKLKEYIDYNQWDVKYSNYIGSVGLISSKPLKAGSISIVTVEVGELDLPIPTDCIIILAKSALERFNKRFMLLSETLIKQLKLPNHITKIEEAKEDNILEFFFDGLQNKTFDVKDIKRAFREIYNLPL